MKFPLYVTRQIKFLVSHKSFQEVIQRNKSSSAWIRVKKMEDACFPKSRENPIIKKLDSPEFHSIFTPELRVLLDIFKKYKHEIRVAGGAVRDILMKITPKDLDFATDATPDEMKDMFTKENIRMINDNGEKHGTITARILDKENFEITTLRIDLITDGRRAEVKFTKDWKLDANRRDLTINSMFLDFEGNVYDYFFGLDDIEKRRVVFVGDASTRIQEDYLRILRYFRFYGRISSDPDNHDEATIEAIKKNINGLEIISGERIQVEWFKILEGNYARELTNKILECGMGPYMGLPDNPNIDNFNEIYLRAEKNKIKLQPCTLISAMLNNLEEVTNFHLRIKLSSFNRDLMYHLVTYRDEKISQDYLKVLKRHLLHDKTRVSLKKEYILETLRYRGELDIMEEFKKWKLPSFPIQGHLIKPHVKNPKMIGMVIKELKDIWLDHDFKLSQEELEKLIPAVAEVVNETVPETTVKKAKVNK